MEYFLFPSLTKARPAECALSVGSDANRFSAEATLPLYSNLQPSWLSAGALSLGYRSLSGPLQGTPAVILTTRRKQSYVTDSQEKPAWLPGFCLVPGPIIVWLGSGLPLGKLVMYIIFFLINIHFSLVPTFPRPQARLQFQNFFRMLSLDKNSICIAVLFS